MAPGSVRKFAHHTVRPLLVPAGEQLWQLRDVRGHAPGLLLSQPEMSGGGKFSRL